jgi:ornithine cyclodeaminase/alanine dehydrogenase-like protein (mu-crystallin family)
MISGRPKEARVRNIGGDELRDALSMIEAIDALETAFRTQDPDEATPLRSSVATQGGSLYLMPATNPLGTGVKLVTLTGANPERGLPLIHAVYVLFDPSSQAVESVIEGAALTALRTAAVSGLATRYLANPEAHRLIVFGAGVQAGSHVEAMRAVRPITDLIVVSRTPARAEALCDEARTAGLMASTGGPEAVAEADIVCTCTTSPTPVFDGTLLAAGAHVNAVGACVPDVRELDTEAVRRATVVVETRAVAFEEAGDLLLAIREGAITRHHVVADLAELVRGTGVRRSSDDITVFESVGMAFEDLVVARAAMRALA